MKLDHEIRNRLITIPGISEDPIFLTGNLRINASDAGLEIHAEFLLTSKVGLGWMGAPMSFPLSKIIAAIEAGQ